MSTGMNLVILAGNLGTDCETRTTTGGVTTTKFRVACNERIKNKDGGWSDRTEWISVVIFGKRAEALSSILRKGMPVTVQGKLRTSNYDDKEGIKRFKTEVMADEIILGSNSRSSSSSSKQPMFSEEEDMADVGLKALSIDPNDLPF